MALETDLSKMSIAPPDVTPEPIPSPSAPVDAPAQDVPPILDVTPAPPTPPSFSLQSYATEQGFDTSGFKDESEIAAALLRSAQQAAQNEPLADIGRQFAPHADKWGAFQEWQKGQEVEQQRVAAETAAAEKAKLPFEWRSVERDQSWEQHCERDPASGRFVAKTLDGLQYAEKLNAYEDAQKHNAQDLLTNYPEMTTQLVDSRLSAFEEKLNTLIDERWEQKQTEASVTQSTDTWITEHAKDVFVLDATGNAVVGPDGNERLSPKGEALRTHATELQASGMSDPAMIRDYAWRAVVADEAAGKLSSAVTSTPVIPPVVTPPTTPNRFLDRLVGSQNGNGQTQQRGGGIPDDTAPRSISASPGGDLRETCDRLINEQGITLT